MNEKKVPTMLTVREVARTGILPEHAIRLLLKDGKLPAIFVGKKAFINFEKLLELLESSTRPRR
jgi:excisionase family DNA binding protein